MLDTNNNNDVFIDKDQTTTENTSTAKTKPHVIRRNIEDYLEQKALERRLKDIFDDDFLMD
ncbi:MAG: PA3496 family putative envelope integrity protein [Thiolinea sp.]